MRTYNDSEVVYIHKETGLELPLSQLKKHLNEGGRIGFTHQRLKSLEERAFSLDSYYYNVSDVPFSEDFKMFTTGGSEATTLICPRCGVLNVVDSRVWVCANCGEEIRHEGFRFPGGGELC